MSSYLISIHSFIIGYHGQRRAMLGDEEIFSSSVRALLHLSLHSDASRIMRALAPAPTNCGDVTPQPIRRSPGLRTPLRCLLVSVTRIPFASGRATRAGKPVEFHSPSILGADGSAFALGWRKPAGCSCRVLTPGRSCRVGTAMPKDKSVRSRCATALQC
jgi:hypothetical protein